MSIEPMRQSTNLYEQIYCDEDCTPYDVQQDHEPAEFSDGAYRVHYECLTDKEKEIMEANNQ